VGVCRSFTSNEVDGKLVIFETRVKSFNYLTETASG